MRSGDFLLAAQMPAPQRGWAQTYDIDLQPTWGRKFEPPAVASYETAGAIEALLQLYQRTGKKRYLVGALEASEWLQEARRPSGDWARFYELESNLPLFVDKDGALSYEDDDLYEGYGMVGEFGIERVLELVDGIEDGSATGSFNDWDWIFDPTPRNSGEELLRRLVAAGDDVAPFVEDGWINSSTFIDAIASYDRYVSAK
jgi:hypothetical protein